jgi:hypothetical protein
MANPYYIAPAGDMSQGLSGLSAILTQATEKKEKQQAAEAAETKKMQQLGQLRDAYESRDPEKMYEFAIENPEYSDVAYKSAGMLKDNQRQEADDFLVETLSNPANAEQAMQRRAELLSAVGRDPTHTLQMLERYRQNPQAAIEEMKIGLALGNPEKYKAYRDATTAQADAVKGIEVGGSVVNPITGEVIYQGPAKEQEQFQVLSPQEAQQMGLPATGSFKINKTTGEVSSIGGAQTVVNNNMGQATEGERTAGILANRLDFAKSQIDEILAQSPAAQSPGAVPTMLEGAGMDYLARISNPAERQIIEAAQEDMLDAALTLGTGAAYTKEQLQGYKKSYFPQLGDDQKTIEAKAVRLKNLVDAAYTKAGRGAPATRRSGQSDNIATVASQAEYDALPSGATYLEDGIQYRKP